MLSYQQYIREAAVSRQAIDRFVDPQAATWAKHDPICGYRLGNYMPRDGIDGSSTISTSQNNTARKAVIYADRPCRINTYGNSFTQCHQVSDEETWQEYLAAHLGEPVRNFGMGGYGFYQSYRRMLRHEETSDAAEYVMLYLWGDDDHYRSLMRCRYVVHLNWIKQQGPSGFHNPFWAHMEMDFNTGRLVEVENPLPSPGSLYKMCDADFMWEALKDDMMVQLTLFCQNIVADIDLERAHALARFLAFPGIESKDPATQRVQAQKLLMAYGFAASRLILDMADEWAKRKNKKLMIILFCPSATRQLIATGRRYDQDIVDYVNGKGMKYFDMNLIHQEDFKAFNLTVDQYYSRYFIGHYNPAGNHFFAYSLKDAIVQWLNPKPITYRDDGSRVIDFKGYLFHN